MEDPIEMHDLGIPPFHETSKSSLRIAMCSDFVLDLCLIDFV